MEAGVGSGIGTAITETLNNTNKPPVNRKTNKEIWKASATSAGIGLATSGLTAGMNYAITSATPGGYGLMPQLTKGFSEMMKGFLVRLMMRSLMPFVSEGRANHEIS